NRDLAVDAIATGFSFVLREILSRHGLEVNDYKLVPFGATGARWQALRDNKAFAGLLSPPLSQVAVAQGYTNLADVAEGLGGYQGPVAATRRDWAKNNADTVVAFIRGYRAGLEWLRGPANKRAAIALLREEIPETTEAAGEQNYAVLVANPKGFDAGAKIDPDGAKQVLELRQRYGPQGKPWTEIKAYIDESYFERAARPQDVLQTPAARHRLSHCVSGHFPGDCGQRHLNCDA